MNDFENIRSEVKRPHDFEEFWRETQAELAESPLEWERIPCETVVEGYTIEWLRFLSFDEVTIYGWFAAPEASRRGNAGYLWLPGYSYGNPPPRRESLYPNTVTLALNLHGNLPDTPYIHPSKQGKSYITQGIESPRTYLFRFFAAHCLRALEVLACQPEVDPEKLIAGGMSQGGGLALLVASLARSVRLCFADMPWLCDLDRALSLIDRERYRRVPNAVVPDMRLSIAEYAEAHPEKADEIYRTYRYFDPLSHAAKIVCPTQMSAGGRDPSCKPPTIYAVYNEITAPKEMLYFPSAGHEILPEMHDAHLKWVQTRL